MHLDGVIMLILYNIPFILINSFSIKKVNRKIILTATMFIDLLKVRFWIAMKNTTRVR